MFKKKIPKNLFIIYEPSQIDSVLSRLKEVKESEIIALDYEVELILKEQKISFHSQEEFTSSIEGQREPMEFVRNLVQDWYKKPILSFFTHRSILLGESHEIPLLYYFQTLIYYINLLESIIKFYPGGMVIFIPESFDFVSSTSDPTARFKVRSPLDAIIILSKYYNIELKVIKAPVKKNIERIFKKYLSNAREFLNKILIRFINFFITAIKRSRPIKIFVIDTWSHISPFITKMNDVELVMSMRNELRYMGWSAWRTKCRFHNWRDFNDDKVKIIAYTAQQRFVEGWDNAVKNLEFIKLFNFNGISFWPVAEEVLGSIVKTYGFEMVSSIESVVHLLKYYKINRIILLSSTKGYNNLIARLAKNLSIPAIELQHAGEVIEKSHPHAKLPAEYLASYGELTKKNYLRFGVKETNIINIGSPRFDNYSFNSDKSSGPKNLKESIILVIIPPVYLSLEYGHYTTYAVRDYLKAISDIQKQNPDIKLVLKIRPWKTREKFFENLVKTFFNKETILDQYGNIQDLLKISMFVISHNSTVVLESMILGKPVIMYLPKNIDKDFDVFEQKDALFIARTHSELQLMVNRLLHNLKQRKITATKGKQFINDNFSFDGRSVERLIDFIRNLKF